MAFYELPDGSSGWLSWDGILHPHKLEVAVPYLGGSIPTINVFYIYLCFTYLLYYTLRDSFSSHQELSSSFDPRTKQLAPFQN